MAPIPAVADVDIANMAASHLGLSQTVQSLNPPDQSNIASAMAFWYSRALAECLQSAPWNFSYQCAVLASEPAQSPTGAFLGNAYPGWPYSYVYPEDCLQSIAVVTVGGLRLGPAFWSNWWWPYPAQNYAIPKIPFKLAQSLQNPGQMAIFCDVQSTPQSPLYLFYIQYVTNTAQFDPMFTAAFSYLLAWRAGGQLRSDRQKVADARSNFVQLRLDALAQHLNASQQDLERDSPSVLTRW